MLAALAGALPSAEPAAGPGMTAVPALSSFALTNMKWKNHFNNGVVFKPRDAFLYQKRYFKSFLDLEFTIPMHGDQGFADVVAGFWQLVDRMEGAFTKASKG